MRSFPAVSWSADNVQRYIEDSVWWHRPAALKPAPTPLVTSTPEARRMFVVQTHPAQDATARDELRKQFVPVMMPMLPAHECRRVVRGQVRYDSRPLLPGYIFVSFAQDDRWQPICSTPGVKRLLPQPLPQREVDLIEAYCSLEDAPDDMEAASLINQLVRVTDGPFALFQGTCERIERGIGYVALTIFGRICKTPVPLRYLDIVE